MSTYKQVKPLRFPFSKEIKNIITIFSELPLY